MHKKPTREVSGPILWGVEAQVNKETAITLLGPHRCIKELKHPAPSLLFSPSTLLILPLQLGPLASPPPTPPPLQNLLEINSKL